VLGHTSIGGDCAKIGKDKRHSQDPQPDWNRVGTLTIKVIIRVSDYYHSKSYTIWNNCWRKPDKQLSRKLSKKPSPYLMLYILISCASQVYDFQAVNDMMFTRAAALGRAGHARAAGRGTTPTTAGGSPTGSLLGSCQGS
jgi:hypothetical protein